MSQRDRTGARGTVLHIILALAAAVAALRLPLPSFLSAGALMIALGILPGAIVARLLVPGWRGAGRVLLALVLSPFLAGGCGAALLATGLSAQIAGRIVATMAAAAGLLLASRARDHRGRSSDRLHADTIPWIAAAVWTLMIAAVLLGNRNLIPRSDGWYHASVVLQIAGRGFPLENPFFAGLPIRYFWGLHAWAALWLGLAPALGVWVPLVALNLAGAFASMLGITLLARRLGAGGAGMGAAALAATAGCAPFAWGWVVARAFGGRMHGPAEIDRLLGHGILPALETMSTGMIHISVLFFGGKFLVLTFFGLGFAAFAAFILAFVDLAASPGFRRGLVLGAVTAAALFIHTVIGLTCLALVVGWAGWAGLRAAVFGDRRIRHALLPLLAAIAGGIALVLPYIVTVLGGGDLMRLGFSGSGLITWLWGGALLLPAGSIWLWIRRRRNDAAIEVLGFSVLLSIPALFLVLTGNNQSKYFNLLFYMMSAAAGPAWVSWLRGMSRFRRWAVRGGLVIATVPTVAFAFWAYGHDPGEFEFRTNGGADPLERLAFAWARVNTAPETIFVEESPSIDAPVLAGRSLLYGREGWARQSGYGPVTLRVRKAATVALTAARPLGPEERALVDGLGREIVVVARRRGAETNPGSSWNAIPRSISEGAGPYRAIFSNPAIVLYRWD
jgi:hypothetical protein